MTDKDSSVIRVAIVTGGGTGIGKAAALALQATGHHVAPVSYTHLTLPTNREV